MTIAMFPGTFDPITNGHFDLIWRASKIFDTVIVGVLKNSTKTPLFDVHQRLSMATDVLFPLRNVTVAAASGMLVDMCITHNANIIVRGVRSTTDFEYESTLAEINRHLNFRIETFLMIPDSNFRIISSSMVKEIFFCGGDVSEFVDTLVLEQLMLLGESR